VDRPSPDEPVDRSRHYCERGHARREMALVAGREDGSRPRRIARPAGGDSTWATTDLAAGESTDEPIE
jgi:hypothetical protein